MKDKEPMVLAIEELENASHRVCTAPVVMTASPATSAQAMATVRQRQP